MYAIVEIAGQQFKVAKDQKVFVNRLQGEEGSKVSFDKVLLVDDGKVTIGAPAIEGAEVTAKILGHLKGDKVIVFKKKRRKGYKKKNGVCSVAFILRKRLFALRFLFLVLSLFTRFVLVVQKVCRLSVPFPAPSVDTAWTLISRGR